MGRTGTNPLKLALERLLGEPCYHMFECFERPEHMPLWAAAAQGDMPEWDDLLSGYGAAIDFPPAAFWPELMRAYPDALILLSVRNTDEWWRSASQTIFPAVLAMPPGPQHAMIDALWSSRFTLTVWRTRRLPSMPSRSSTRTCGLACRRSGFSNGGLGMVGDLSASRVRCVFPPRLSGRGSKGWLDAQTALA